MIIKEFLPNPAGSDKDGEYIKLFNDGNVLVNLNGWSIKNFSGKIYNLNGELGAQKELVLPYLKTKIFLSNNGETIFLYKNGALIDKLGYAGGIGLRTGKIITRKQLAANELQNSQLINPPISNQLNNTPQFIFLDFLTAAILAALGLYIILELEKKLEIKLF